MRISGLAAVAVFAVSLTAVAMAAACASKKSSSPAPVPVVSSTFPADGANNVPADSTVTATFSQLMNAATIDGSSFELALGTTAITASVTYAGSIATLTPAAALATGATFTATVTTGATSAAGAALAANHVWSFTTATTATSTFALTSSMLTEGGAFPANYTCSGTNVSPPLAWTAGPAGTLSYGITLTDLTIGLIHWAIWDIPAVSFSLPEAVPNVAMPAPAPAKQVTSYDDSTFGYLGPCPGGATHTYQFKVYALDVATLPGVTTASMRPDVETAMQAHGLSTATLSGTSNAM